jgi:hypothetical protein
MEAGSVEPRIANIKQEWHWVRPGLEEIYGMSPHVAEIPEDVYAACMAGHAHLWITDDYFVVTKFGEDNGLRGLHLWHAWAKQRGDKHSLAHHDFFEGLALQNGCQYMQTQTVHQPLVDHFTDRLGYRVKVHILEKDIG